MNDLSTTTKQFKPKTFWERPEGVTGQIVGVAMVASAGYLMYQALPFIIKLLQNTIYASILGVIAVALGFVITDKRFWLLGKYMYMSLMRKITAIFITIDPIGILKNYVQGLQEKLANMEARISRLAGMIAKCKAEIDSNTKSRDRSLKTLQAAKGSNQTMAMQLAARDAGRMNEVNLTYQDLLVKLELLYRVLSKYQEVSKFLIQDMLSEIKVKERKKEMMDNAFSAMQSARSIINGDPDARALFDAANEHLAADYSMKIGEIEDFSRVSDSFMRSVDLQNGIYEQDALQMLATWEKGVDSLLLGDDKRLIIESSHISRQTEVKSAKTLPSTDLSGVNWFDKK